MGFSFGLSLGASADWLSTNWRTPLSMSDSVVFNRFLNNTYMSASYRRATRLARWNKKPSESSVRRVPTPAMQRTHVYEVRPRKDHRGVNLISDALPFGALWYGEPNAVANAIGYAKFFSRSHDAVIRVYKNWGTLVPASKFA
jgi:hypothetical protein